MAVGDASRMESQIGEDGSRKQIEYLTEKLKEYRARAKEADRFRSENESLKMRAEAATSLEVGIKSVGSELEKLRDENKKLRVKNDALIKENGIVE